jgi:succinoglycan biosynthesis protein ExoM
MSTPLTVDVCICTYQRPQLVFTLRSLAELELPFGCQLRVVVADNDQEPSAQVTARTMADELGLTLEYIHAPAHNISIARNACLDAASATYVAFVDDDEIVSSKWLIAMLETFDSAQADIVLGPVQALYPAGCADWLRVGDFHSTRPVYVGGKIITGYAGNVMMKRECPALQGIRFQEDLGITGGEDTDFFGRAYKAGATIDYAEAALVLEGMSESRATLNWLVRRRWRFGQTHALLLRETGGGGKITAAKAFAKALACFGMMLLTVLYPIRRRYWLLRGTLHLAVAQTLRKHK